MSNVKTELYRIARPVKEIRNKYEWLAINSNLYNYREITYGEILVRGKHLNLPLYIKEFIKVNNEVLLMANMVGNEVLGIVFRGIKDKAFINYGFGKGMFYGIGDLDKDFKYGDLIVLVEGTIDRDLCSKYITKNCLSVLTSTVTKNQAKVLKCLTNRVLLLLDNDEAGNKGTYNTKRKLNALGITAIIIKKSNRIKDLGDLAVLLQNNDREAKNIIDMYRVQVILNGGKVVEV